MGYGLLGRVDTSRSVGKLLKFPGGGDNGSELHSGVGEIKRIYSRCIQEVNIHRTWLLGVRGGVLRTTWAPAGVALSSEHGPVKPKGSQFNSWSGTCLGCGPGPQLGPCESRPIDVSLPLFLPPFPSL